MNNYKEQENIVIGCHYSGFCLQVSSLLKFATNHYS